MDTDTKSTRRTIVHLVHGTWGRGLWPVVREELGLARRVEAPSWFEDGSPFRRGLTQLLPPEIEFRTFNWSGSNSFAARAHAARDFGLYLQQQFAAAGEAIHLLIGHSHAGNVFMECLTTDGLALGRAPDRILTMATPYLTLESTTSDERLVLNTLLPLCLALYMIAFAATLAFSGHSWGFGWAFLTFAAYGLAMRVQPWVTNRPSVLIAVRATAIVAALVAAYCAYRAFAQSLAFTYPGDSGFGALQRLLFPPLGGLLAAANGLFLIAACLAGSTGSNAFLLKDLVRSVAGLYVAFVLAGACSWAFRRGDDLPTSLFQMTLLFGPFLVSASLAFESVLAWIVERTRGIWRVDGAEQDFVDLPCPLDAVRLPGDEASQAILAAQLVRVLTSCPLAVWQWVKGLTTRVGWSLIGGLSALGFAMAFAMMDGGPLAGPIRLMLAAVLGPLLMFSVLLFGVLMLLPLLITASVFAFAVTGLSVGTDVIRLLPAIAVACEPLPRCDPRKVTLTMLWPRAEDRLALPLRHSMYDLDAVQKWVADWIVRARQSSIGNGF